MRSRLPLILLALLLGGAATFLMFQQMESYKQKLKTEYAGFTQGLNPVPVVVAAQDVTRRGTVLTEEMLSVIDIPEKALQPYAVQDLMEALGKEPLGPLRQGQQLLQNQLAVPGAVGGTLAMKIPPEKRAISMDVNFLTMVSGFVRPGDHIDILWTYRGGEQPVTLTLFQNVEVLAVGTQMRAVVAEGEEPREANTVTLALTPQESELLLFAGTQGSFQLSLRPRSDSLQQVALPPVTMEAFLQHVFPQAQPAAPPAPSMTMKQVEIIRGKTREMVALSETGEVVQRAPLVAPNPPPPPDAKTAETR